MIPFITYKALSADKFANTPDGIDVILLLFRYLQTEDATPSITYKELSADRFAKAPD